LFEKFLVTSSEHQFAKQLVYGNGKPGTPRFRERRNQSTNWQREQRTDSSNKGGYRHRDLAPGGDILTDALARDRSP
jgi:hypothetical protein